jgi:hypothetical protein
METYRVNLYDEAPNIGCGWRIVNVVKRGWKWVLVADKSSGKRKKFPAKQWKSIERKAKCLNQR